MTPLAQSIVRDMLRPARDRQFRGELADIIKREILGGTFFECSEVMGLATELVRCVGGQAAALRDLAFLPGPLTWLEFDNAGGRAAIVLMQTGESEAFFMGVVGVGGQIQAAPIGFIYLRETESGDDGTPLWRAFSGDMDTHRITLEDQLDMIWRVYGLLNLINRPGGLRFDARPVHRGMLRDLTNRKMVGTFPLLAWTVRTLSVSPGGSGREPKNAGTTGDRCLHFVRQHQRRLDDRIIVIPWHWRGDPALGIKQTRYRLAA